MVGLTQNISFCTQLHSTSVHITAVMVEYKTPTGRINRGVTTSWLKEKHPSDPPCLVPIFVRKSQFRLPTRTTIPIIMVGPGTGIAPFRGFIQERDLARKGGELYRRFLSLFCNKLDFLIFNALTTERYFNIRYLNIRSQGKQVGDTILYFGCRKSEEDYLYYEELAEYVKNGSLILHTAFSREQPHKVYVTHLLEQNKEEIWRVIGEQNGHIYICGLALPLLITFTQLYVTANENSYKFIHIKNCAFFF